MPAPPAVSEATPAAGGKMPAWLWIVVLLVVAAVAYFVLA